MTNYGVILGRQPTDYVAGAIPHKVVNPSAVWTPYTPPGEWQWKAGKETMACVSFSAINSIEMQELLLTGRQVNYSDRWLALMSGTTPQGNYLWKVADTIRKYGLVREESWPAPDSFDWNTYYAKPSPAKQAELEAEGKRWLQTHAIAYEWVNDFRPQTVVHHLKHCPLQVVIPGHAVVEIANLNEAFDYFDTYEPFIKQYAQNGISDILKIVLTINNMITRYIVQKGNKLGILVSVDGDGIFTDTVFWAKSEEHFKQLKVQYEVPDNALRIVYPV
jgi:hypothetical protein